MKKLFAGKKKIITIPLFIILVFYFPPFIIGGTVAYFIYKKINNKLLKYTGLTVVILVTLIFGSGWILALNSPENITTNSNHHQSSSSLSTITGIVTKKPTLTVKETLSPTKTPASTSIPSTPTPTKTNNEIAKVVRVIDGDTVDVSINGNVERVRIIGINTPESVDPRKSVECFGREASAKAKEYLDGNTVELEADRTQANRDKYNRLLRYVWLDSRTVDFGKLMIATGYAYEYTYNLPYKYQTEYKQAQKEAEAAKLGLWADGVCVVTPTLIPTKIPTQSSTTQSTSQSSCKYPCDGPDRDCSDFSTHAEAIEFFNCCGFSATYDPMKLDSTGIGDGNPCESLP
jgi:micrococcal nuclease